MHRRWHGCHPIAFLSNPQFRSEAHQRILIRRPSIIQWRPRKETMVSCKWLQTFSGSRQFGRTERQTSCTLHTSTCTNWASERHHVATNRVGWRKGTNTAIPLGQKFRPCAFVFLSPPTQNKHTVVFMFVGHTHKRICFFRRQFHLLQAQEIHFLLHVVLCSFPRALSTIHIQRNTMK